VKRSILLVPAAVFLAAGPLDTCGPPAGTLTAVHAAAIRDSVQATLDAFRQFSAAGEWDSLAGLYADDANFRWLEQGVVQYRSPAMIRQALGRVAPGTRIETTYRDTKILALAPGVGAVSTAFYTKFVDAGKTAAEFGGVLDMTLVHREEGWRILLGHSSSRPR
jgi:SnoaL-like domain